MLTCPTAPTSRAAWASLERVGTALLAGALATSTWNAVRLAGLPPSDLALVAAVGVLALVAALRGHLPRLPVPLAAGALLVASAGVLTALNPPDPLYAALRLRDTMGQAPVDTGGDLAQLLKFELALVVVPLALLLVDRGRLRLLTACWVASSLLGCAVALTDELGLTALSLQLLGVADATGRQSGLSATPNHLAVSAVLALPVLLVWAVRGAAAERRLALLGVPLLLGGILVSGSRGGLVAALAVTGVALAAAVRREPRGLVLLAAGALLAVAALAPRAGDLLQRLRLTGESADRSDAARSVLLEQGLADAAHRPLHGVGFSVINAAHEVHVQLLAAGGLLALGGWVLYVCGALASRRAAAATDPLLAAAALASLVVWLLLGVVENQVADRYLYVPVGVLVALAAAGPPGAGGPPGRAVDRGGLRAGV